MFVTYQADPQSPGAQKDTSRSTYAGGASTGGAEGFWAVDSTEPFFGDMWWLAAGCRCCGATSVWRRDVV